MPTGGMRKTGTNLTLRRVSLLLPKQPYALPSVLKMPGQPSETLASSVPDSKRPRANCLFQKPASAQPNVDDPQCDRRHPPCRHGLVKSVHPEEKSGDGVLRGNVPRGSLTCVRPRTTADCIQLRVKKEKGRQIADPRVPQTLHDARKRVGPKMSERAVE
jgi:hypothetical protein